MCMMAPLVERKGVKATKSLPLATHAAKSDYSGP
jgi:hypothetical protein